MALLFQHEQDNNRYQVRSAGKSLRLYRNGVFHSQFNSDNPFSGSVWDYLSLPVCYLAPRRCYRILLLGVGGGAVIRQLELLAEPMTITGIDIDPVHIDIARDWFGVSADYRLIADDAVNWVKRMAARQRPPQFDMIIDDLFADEDKEPYRIQPLSSTWADNLFELLSPQGIVVANAFSRSEHQRSGLRWHQRCQQLWINQLEVYENCIGVYSEGDRSVDDWCKAISGCHQLGSHHQRKLLINRYLKQLTIID